MSKKMFSLVGMIIGCVFVLVGILSFSGVLGGNTSYPSSAPYSYDSGYATFGGDYYTYSVNNTAETAGAARTTAANLDDIAEFLKTFCGLFSICFGVAVICCFGICYVGLRKSDINVTTEPNLPKAEEFAVEEVVAEEVVAEEVVTEE